MKDNETMQHGASPYELTKRTLLGCFTIAYKDYVWLNLSMRRFLFLEISFIIDTI